MDFNGFRRFLFIEIDKLEKNLIDSENLVLYNRFSATSAGHLNITGGSSAGTWTTEKYETGQYIAIKYRVDGGRFQFYVNTKEHGANPSASDGRPHYSYIGEFSGTEEMSDWKVAVIKIPDNVRYTCNSEQEIHLMIASFDAYTIDIAYVAVVDSIDEAKGLLGAGEDYYFFNGAIANEGGELNGGNDAASDTEGSGS